VIEERRGLRLSGLLVIGVLVAVVVTAAGIFPFHQILGQQDSVSLAERQLEALQEENRRLEAEIAALQTPEEVERLARERFGLVRPGEISYVVVAPEGDTPRLAEPEPVLERDETPWWRDLWDFMTGKDVSSGDE
jgi:cell division protein FtsL